MRGDPLIHIFFWIKPLIHMHVLVVFIIWVLVVSQKLLKVYIILLVIYIYMCNFFFNISFCLILKRWRFVIFSKEKKREKKLADLHWIPWMEAFIIFNPNSIILLKNHYFFTKKYLLVTPADILNMFSDYL